MIEKIEKPASLAGFYVGIVLAYVNTFLGWRTA